MKSLLAAAMLTVAFVWSSPAQSQTPTPQQRLDTFLGEHEPLSTVIFCRTDIVALSAAPSFATSRKQLGKTSPSFQITFSAPVRQAGGTEFFLKNEAPYHSYTRMSDSSIDGKVNVALEDADQQIYVSHKDVKIKDIKFGALTADLTFGRKSAELKGVNQPVQISYPRFSKAR